MEGGPVALDVRVLGPLAVWDGDREVALRGPKQRLLLASLLVRANETVPTDGLVDDLWGTGGSEKALHALRVHVSTLRRALDGGDGSTAPIVTAPGGYRLEVPGDAIDADRFGQCVAEGSSLATAGRFADAVEAFDRALALWRGDAYGELAPLEPIQAEARRLDDLRQAVLEDRTEAILHLGRPGEVVGAMREHVERNPYRERAWSLLIRALYLDGQQKEALEAYAEVRTLLDEELGVAPTPELEELQRRILRHEMSPPRPRPRSASPLPVPFTSFVGRDDELRQLRDLLDRARLVTVTGIGGVGKTRLVLRAASEMRARFPDGVGWAELAPLRDPELVADTALVSFGLPQVPDETATDTLIARLQGQSALLVLDNCEHLLDACAELAERLLQAAPGVCVLCTSREALRLPGERTWSLDPFGTTEPDDHGPAVRLFADRANDVDPSFELTPATTPLVSEICRRVDGLPLAIELAAVQIGLLPLHEIVHRLDDRFALLARGSRTADARQATLEGMLDWSYELLVPEEQSLLAALSVFAGSFDLEAVESVCRGALPESASILDALHGLVAQSLVTVAPGGGGRFQLLETVRHYASRHLDEERLETFLQRHGAHYLGVVRAAAPRLQGSEQLTWLARLDADIDNLRQVLEHAAREGDREMGLELAGHLSRFWFLRSHLREGRRWIRTFLDGSGDVPGVLRARALVGVGAFLWEQGRDDDARERLVEGRQLAADHGSRSLEGWALAYLGLVDNLDGRHQDAVEHTELALERFGETNLVGFGFAMWQRAVAGYLLRRDDGPSMELRVEARMTLEALLEAARPYGERNLVGHLLWSLGIVALDGNEWEQARPWLLESLESFSELGLRSCATHTLDQVARGLSLAGDPASACLLLAASKSIREQLGVPGHVIERREWETAMATVKERLDAPAFEKQWAAGRGLDLDTAIRLAKRIDPH